MLCILVRGVEYSPFAADLTKNSNISIIEKTDFDDLNDDAASNRDGNEIDINNWRETGAEDTPNELRFDKKQYKNRNYIQANSYHKRVKPITKVELGMISIL